MTIAIFILMLLITILGGARLALWIYGGSKDHDLNIDEWWSK
jgi:hypothetical protein